MNESSQDSIQNASDKILESASGGGFFSSAGKFVFGAYADVIGAIGEGVSDFINNTNETKLKKASTINKVANEMNATATTINQAIERRSKKN